MAVLNTIAPFDTAEDWDNVGLMVGDLESPVRSVIVALDPSLEVIRAAKDAGVDLILTHHPLIFKPMSRFDLKDALAQKISMLLLTRINLISMHTNLDKAPGGVADVLAKRLALTDISSYGYVRIGRITGSPSPLNTWVASLGISGTRLIDSGRDVSLVAVCPGSGMEYWRHALSLGCDTFVTGDVRYHAGEEAREAGMNVVDMGHFGTEEIIVAPLAERLKQELKGVTIHAHKGRDVFSL